MSELVSQALDLVFYGMGTVFVFLTLLVGMTILMSWILQSENHLGAARTDVDLAGNAVDPKLIAAITAAVKRHRHSKQ